VPVTPEDEAEMRAHFQAVLRANRELGPDYEKIAVDQLMQKVRGGGTGGAATPPPAAPPPGYGPRQSGCASRGTCWSPWAIFGLIAGLFWIVPVLFGAAAGLAALVLCAVVVAAIVRRVFRRFDPWGGGPWAYRAWGPGRRRFGGW
jgi:hypothetical protein